jgi:hypothetical protein
MGATSFSGQLGSHDKVPNRSAPDTAVVAGFEHIFFRSKPIAL